MKTTFELTGNSSYALTLQTDGPLFDGYRGWPTRCLSRTRRRRAHYRSRRVRFASAPCHPPSAEGGPPRAGAAPAASFPPRGRWRIQRRRERGGAVLVERPCGARRARRRRGRAFVRSAIAMSSASSPMLASWRRWSAPAASASENGSRSQKPRQRAATAPNSASGERPECEVQEELPEALVDRGRLERLQKRLPKVER
jgi:hypothetical protein